MSYALCDMIVFAGISFFSSLAAIMGLVAVKLHEIDSGTIVAPRMKQAADREALRVKQLLFAAKIDLTKILPILVYWGHVAVHRAAIEFARFARTTSRKAHQLADFVSHKRNFEPRQTKSEFLRQMSLGKREVQDGQVE